MAVESSAVSSNWVCHLYCAEWLFGYTQQVEYVYGKPIIAGGVTGLILVLASRA
jgi:hypothetical protein